MAAAAWTKYAEDITGDRARWDDYLDAAQLSDRIGLAEATIMDILTRSPQEGDPRIAIYRPAARLGQTRLSAVPMWKPEQAEQYLEMDARRTNASNRADLPVYSLQEATDRGLASTDELAAELGVAENSIRRWSREVPDFPPEVGQAERIPPFQFGPPRVLRSLDAVRRWVLENARLDDEHRARLERDLAPTPAA